MTFLACFFAVKNPNAIALWYFFEKISGASHY